jgi:hypothetical protein
MHKKHKNRYPPRSQPPEPMINLLTIRLIITLLDEGKSFGAILNFFTTARIAERTNQHPLNINLLAMKLSHDRGTLHPHEWHQVKATIWALTESMMPLGEDIWPPL